MESRQDECLFCGRVILGRKCWQRFCSASCFEAYCDRAAHPRPASVATSALPGSPAKIEVMRARVARGEECFHPKDANWADVITE